MTTECQLNSKYVLVVLEHLILNTALVILNFTWDAAQSHIVGNLGLRLHLVGISSGRFRLFT